MGFQGKECNSVVEHLPIIKVLDSHPSIMGEKNRILDFSDAIALPNHKP